MVTREWEGTSTKGLVQASSLAPGAVDPQAKLVRGDPTR